MALLDARILEMRLLALQRIVGVDDFPAYLGRQGVEVTPEQIAACSPALATRIAEACGMPADFLLAAFADTSAA